MPELRNFPFARWTFEPAHTKTTAFRLEFRYSSDIQNLATHMTD